MFLSPSLHATNYPGHDIEEEASKPCADGFYMVYNSLYKQANLAT